jgi:hypothetical protein
MFFPTKISNLKRLKTKNKKSSRGGRGGGIQLFKPKISPNYFTSYYLGTSYIHVKLPSAPCNYPK